KSSTTRSGEVVIRSMILSQMAYILTAIGPELVVILNTLIVSHFLGTECFKAISAFNPISGMLLILINTCCLGPSIHAGKAYGELNSQKANKLFSLSAPVATAIGIISAFVIFVFKSSIAEKMTPDLGLQGYLVDYIGPTSLYIMLSAATCILNTFVTASGNVKRVTTAVLTSGVANVTTIFILINVFHFGVEAAGIALCISALVNIAILLPLALRKRFPFRLVVPDFSMLHLVKENALAWISLNSSTLSEGLLTFFINIIILHFLTSDGLFIWGVCQMTATVIIIVAIGLQHAYLYVDTFLMGEGDNAGRLKIAKSLLLEITIVLVSFAIIFTLFTDKFAVLFGANTNQLILATKIPLICIIWFDALHEILLTFSVISVQRWPMIKLGYDILATVATPTLVFLAALLLGGTNLWLGFVITPLFFISYIAIINIVYCRKDRNLIPFFLLNKINDIVTLDVSISYSMENIQKELSRIRTFLGICEISETLAGKIELCCEELMVNVRGMNTSGGTFDIRLSDCESSVNIVAKSFGKPISPIINNRIARNFLRNGTIPDAKELSMFCIIHSSDKIDYRYVYGMNVAYFQFNKEYDALHKY
ncbi:MAG: MATE family efflux transporter, partial [Prevotellaceae bacterium]|nr:MATE family efflux transporter [Prevotellaceae bacterium]